MRTSDQIKDEIISRFGFFPPFFAPALETPQILENLWQQTLSAYVENPIPALFKEKIAAIVARSCSVPYCLVCHTCRLRPLGMKGHEILAFLDNWDDPAESDKTSLLNVLVNYQGPVGVWPEEGSEVEKSILHTTIALYFGDDDLAPHINQLVRILGKTYYNFLTLSIAYNKTCLTWAEFHPIELAYEADDRAKEHLQPLLNEEPKLAHFFANYARNFYETSKLNVKKNELQKSEKQYRNLNKELENRIQLATQQLEKELTERKLSEQNLTVLIEAIPQIVWTSNPDGNLDYYNQHWFDYTGMTLEQTHGWGWKPVVHPDDLQLCIDKWAQAYRSGDDYQVEYRFKRALDGMYRWHLGRARPVRDGDGNIVKWFGTCTDIHDQKSSIELLRQSDAKFKYMYNSSTFGIIFWNVHGEITDANHQFLELLGFSEEDLTSGKIKWSELTPPEYHHLDDKALKQIAIDRFCQPYEKQFFRKDGSRLPILVGASLLEGNDHEGLCYVIDLSEKKKAEKEVSENQLKLKTVLNHSPIILWATDVFGTITYSDGYGLHSLGFEPGQLVGHSLFEMDKDNPESIHGLKRALSGESFSVEAKTGELYFDTHYAPLSDQTGNVVGMVALTTDITSRKNADFERNAALNREASAKAASEMKSNFLATMSHEIRTPINGVIGMASLLIDTELNAAQRSYVDAVRSSADMLLTLVNDILDISKAEAGKVDLESIDFEIEHLVLDVERTLTFASSKKGLKLFRSVAPDLPAHFRGDPSRLRQVVINLVNNAIKFTSHGQVSLEIKPEKIELDRMFLRFEISDTGIGISEESIHRLFQAFSQADCTTTRRFGGTGLGLSISKHLVNLMGGEIGVRSEVGKGSTFWFVIPLEMGNPNGLGSPVTARAPKNQRRLRILIADDNSINQTIAIKMLEKLGHSAIAVGNGQEAIDALDKTHFDLLFMDCHMPELDGYEATKYIRKSKLFSFSNIPIIAMTANAMIGDREKCLDAGMNDYISKPMKLEGIIDVIERTLDSHRRSA